MESEIKILQELDRFLTSYRDLLLKSIDVYDGSIIRNGIEIENLEHKILAYYSANSETIKKYLRDTVEHSISAIHFPSKNSHIKSIRREIVMAIAKLEQDIAKKSDIRLTPSLLGQTFSYLGQSVEIGGQKELSALSLMINQINSIVTADMFIKEVYGQDLEVESKKYNKTTAKANSKKLYSEVKKKLYDNKTFNRVLVVVQKNGYGIFIDQNELEKVISELSP